MREEEIKNREANRANRKVETKSISEIFLSKSEKMAEILTILGVIGMLLSVGIVYFNNIYTLPNFFNKGLFIGTFFIFYYLYLIIYSTYFLALKGG